MPMYFQCTNKGLVYRRAPTLYSAVLYIAFV